MSAQVGKRVWLIRWDWAGDHAKVDGDPIVAVLPCQWGVDQIKKLVDFVHDSRELTLEEMAYFATKRSERPYKAHLGRVTVDVGQGPVSVEWEGSVYCGHNPWVEAIQATVVVDPETHGIQSWEPIPKPGQ